jgi:hypothetical protein
MFNFTTNVFEAAGVTITLFVDESRFLNMITLLTIVPLAIKTPSAVYNLGDVVLNHRSRLQLLTKYKSVNLTSSFTADTDNFATSWSAVFAAIRAAGKAVELFTIVTEPASDVMILAAAIEVGEAVTVCEFESVAVIFFKVNHNVIPVAIELLKSHTNFIVASLPLLTFIFKPLKLTLLALNDFELTAAPFTYNVVESIQSAIAAGVDVQENEKLVILRV